MRRFILLLTFVILIINTFSFNYNEFKEDINLLLSEAQYDQGVLFSEKELLMDLKLVNRLLIELYPNPEFYFDKGEFDTMFNYAYDNLHDNTAYFTFYKYLHAVLDKIGDGNISVEHSEVENEKVIKGNKIPFKLRIADNNVHFSSRGFEIPYGAQVLSINGIDIDKMLNDLSMLIFTDGTSIQYKYGIFKYQTEFANLVYNFYGDTEGYDITYLFNNRMEETYIKAKPFTNMGMKKSSENEGIVFERKDIETSYISISGNPDIEYAKEEFEILFKVLKRSKTKNLIIDLRRYADGNEEVLKELLRYLIKYEGKLLNPDVYATQEIPYKEYLISSSEEIAYVERELKNSRLKRSTNKYVSKRTPINFVTKKDLLFDGKVYVLFTSSMINNSVRFLSLLEYYSDAISVGEETRGGALITTEPAKLKYELPNTGIRIEMPHKERSLRLNQFNLSGRGVIPDKIFMGTYEELFENKDVKLERVLWEIEQESLLQKEFERIQLETEKEAEFEESENFNNNN